MLHTHPIARSIAARSTRLTIGVHSADGAEVRKRGHSTKEGTEHPEQSVTNVGASLVARTCT